MHLAILVVGHRIGLELFGDKGIGDDNGGFFFRSACRLVVVIVGWFVVVIVIGIVEIIVGILTADEVKDIQELAAVSSCITQQGAGLLHLDFSLRDDGVFLQDTFHQAQQVVVAKRLEGIDLATAQQGANHLERRVLGGGTDECDDTTLDGIEQRILLRFREAMDFVDEEDGRSIRQEETILLGSLDHFAHLLDAAAYG